MGRKSDSILVLEVQSGQDEAFGELVRRYQTAVYNVAYRMFGQAPEAEDATQEAFLRAFQAMDRFEAKRPFAPWIKRITVNICLNIIDKKQNKTQTAVTDLSNSNQENEGMDRWETKTATPEQTIVKQEQSAQLRAAILALSPTYRAVIEYRHFQDLSYEEISTIIATPSQ